MPSWPGALSADLSRPERGCGVPSSARPGHMTLWSPSVTVTPGRLDPLWWRNYPAPARQDPCSTWRVAKTFPEEDFPQLFRGGSTESMDPFSIRVLRISDPETPLHLAFFSASFPGMKCGHLSIKCHNMCAICVFVCACMFLYVHMFMCFCVYMCMCVYICAHVLYMLFVYL